jgi:hypothetical protein
VVLVAPQEPYRCSLVVVYHNDGGKVVKMLTVADLGESSGVLVGEPEECVYTVEDLFDLFFPEELGVTGYLTMVYSCFLDDSKDALRSKMFVSAGFFGDKDDWKNLRVAWSACLKRNNIAYYKASEYNRLEGEFARFRTAQYPRPTGRDAAYQIKYELQEIVKANQRIRGVGVAVLVDDYEKVRSHPEAKDIFGPDPYHCALESVMFETVKIVRALPGHNMVAFVHDEQDDFNTLRDLYLGFKKLNPKTAKVMGGFSGQDDKTHPPLQAADMIANNTLEVGMDWLSQGKLDKLRFELLDNRSLVGLWNEEYMLSVLKANLGRKGRPVPIDLSGEQHG